MSVGMRDVYVSIYVLIFSNSLREDICFAYPAHFHEPSLLFFLFRFVVIHLFESILV